MIIAGIKWPSGERKGVRERVRDTEAARVTFASVAVVLLYPPVWQCCCCCQCCCCRQCCCFQCYCSASVAVASVAAAASVALFLFSCYDLCLIGNLCVSVCMCACFECCSECCESERTRVSGRECENERLFVCGLMAIAIVDTFILFAFSIY